MKLNELLKEVKKIKGSHKDGLLKVIHVNKKMTVTVLSPMYSDKKRKITEYFDECRVVSINGRVKATLINKSKQFANVVIFEESTHGGAGRGQGRKLKFKEETTTLSVRVPVSKKEELKNIVSAKLEEWSVGGI